MKKAFFIIMIFSAFISAQIKESTTAAGRTVISPVFIGSDKNIIKIIDIKTCKDENNEFLNEIAIEAGDSFTSKCIRSVKVFAADGDKYSLLAETDKFSNRRTALKFRYKLSEGVNSFKLSVTVAERTQPDLPLKIKCSSIKVNDRKFDIDNKFTDYRIGYIIRKPGDDNVKSYRIPGLVTSNKGTLLAVYDIRKNSSKDLPADIDVGLSRSTDHGLTWGPVKKIIDMGEPQDQNGAGDPAILVDKKTGTIWVAALWSHGNRGWAGSKPGLTPEETGQLVLVKSSDDGITWSKPESITRKIKNPNWNLFFQGPGNGISLKNGILVFPAQFKDSVSMPYSTIIYSTDRGLNWKSGKGAKPNTTEAQVVELQNGALMLNMRDNRGGSRSICTTTDLGNSWIEHTTSRSALIEPVCMASFIRVFNTSKGKRNSLLAFSNPDSRINRDSITIKLSNDEGNSWNKIPSILIDERECFGYSCLTKIDDKYLGLLYEGNGEIYFIKVKIPDEIFRWRKN